MKTTTALLILITLNASIHTSEAGTPAQPVQFKPTKQTASFDGGDGPDYLVGSDAADSFDGGDGPDYLVGSDAADSFDGGDGPDYLVGSDAADSFDGGDGPDYLVGSDAADSFDGGDGPDYLVGSDAADSFDGGDGPDYLVSSDAADSFDGGDGPDYLVGSDAADSFANIYVLIDTAVADAKEKPLPIESLWAFPAVFDALHAKGPAADELRGYMDWLILAGLLIGQS